MSIQTIAIDTKENLISVLEDLDYFDTVENNASTNQIECSVGSDVVLKIPSSTSTSASVEFFSTAEDKTFSISAVTLPRIVYRTRNGIMAVKGLEGSSSSNSGNYALIVGKTNNGAIACTCTGKGGTTGKYDVKSGAVGEWSSDITSVIKAMQSEWSSSPQITSIPIPTHPSTGVSYIKGAKAVMCGPLLNVGTVTINNVEYATYGIVMLSDEA